MLSLEWQPQKAQQLPLYKQIILHIKQKISVGEWPAGTRLPSQRAMADQLKVNRSTLTTALEELTADGFIESHPGSGTWVAHNSWSLLAAHPPAHWQRYMEEGSQPPNSSILQAIHHYEYAPKILRLSTGELAEEFFPTAQLQQALSGLSPSQLPLGYEQAKGFLPLREEIAAYLEGLSISLSSASILITSGALQGLQLIAHSLLPKDSGILLEQPSYLYSQKVFQATGNPTFGLPMDQNGLCLLMPPYGKRRQQAGFLYTIPCYHNPTGITMSLERRRQLITLCQQEQLPILEDDVYRELWLEAPPPLPLKAFDKTGQVLYIGSFSKWLCPGLRIGWIAGPEPVIDRLADVKMQYDYGASSLSQQAAYQWLKAGHLPVHLAQLREKLLLRRDYMLALLHRYFSHLANWNCPAGGFYIWLSLHQPRSMEQLFKEALQQQLLLHPGLLYDPTDQQHLRLSYSYLPLPAMDKALKTLAAIIEKLPPLLR